MNSTRRRKRTYPLPDEIAERPLEDDGTAPTAKHTKHNGVCFNCGRDCKQTSHFPPAHRAIRMQCSLPPHQGVLEFESYEEYEVHYLKEHTHRCVECGKNFPTAHFLNLHLEEWHDPLVQVRKARGEKTYRCFVEPCDKICLNTYKRRLHLIDKHGYPKTFDFGVIKTGIDGKNSMLRYQKPKAPFRSRKPPNSTPGSESPDVPHDATAVKTESQSSLSSENAEAPSSENAETPKDEKDTETPSSEDAETPKNEGDTASVDTQIETVTSKMSSLSFIPLSVRSRNREVKR